MIRIVITIITLKMNLKINRIIIKSKVANKSKDGPPFLQCSNKLSNKKWLNHNLTNSKGRIKIKVNMVYCKLTKNKIEEILIMLIKRALRLQNLKLNLYRILNNNANKTDLMRMMHNHLIHQGDFKRSIHKIKQEQIQLHKDLVIADKIPIIRIC
jgi:hypothetical protein